MNIPPKYEDVVAKLEAERLRADVAVADCNDAERREAALHEEFDAYKIKRTEFAHKVGDLTEKSEQIIDALQQRLTVAEQRLSQVEGACDLAMSAIDDDERGANFVKIIQAIKDKAALKPAETLFEKGQRLFREGQGSSGLWGECSNDAELPEVHRGWMAAYDAAALKPATEGDGS